MSISRRSFLRSAGLGMGASAFLTGLHRLGLSTASASYCAVNPSYKALVCVFLYGGNDGNNMVVPNNAAGAYAYSKYSAVRNPTTCDFYIQQAGGGALPDHVGLPIAPTNLPGSSFMLHPKMTNLQSKFASNKLAILANAGTLIKPTHKDALGQLVDVVGAPVALPQNLMAHDQQQREWQLGRGDPALSDSVGWGGAIADQLAFPGFPMVVSDAGASTFTQSLDLTKGPLVVSPSGTFGLTDSSGIAGTTLHVDDNWAYVNQLAGQSVGNQYIGANQQIMRNALTYADALNGALAGCSKNWSANLWSSGGRLTSQLKKIANIIAAAGTGGLGLTRQIFFCSLGGFDTHANQWDDQNELLAEVDIALNAFYTAMGEINAGSQVTSFTMTDFGRTFQPGSYSGTDHAWGNHQLILGDAVNGGQLYGTYPDLTLGGADDKDGVTVGTGEGRWIPTTSAEQYAATLAKWFDPTITLTGVGGLFPNLANFSPQTLAFL